MKLPKYEKKHDRLRHGANTAVEIECDMILAPLSKVNEDMARKWGYNILETLVSSETAAKWGKAVASLNKARDELNPAEVLKWANVCIRGLRAMDQEAEAADCKRVPEAWEYQDDDHHFVLIRDAGMWPLVSDRWPGLPVYTIREAAVAMAARREGIVDAVKQAFPGAQIERIRPLADNDPMNDLIDFGDKLS